MSGAVSSEVTPTGVVETVPKNDAEWALVRRHALMMGEALDTACESCHLRFWYPDQERLLKNALG